MVSIDHLHTKKTLWNDSSHTGIWSWFHMTFPSWSFSLPWPYGTGTEQVSCNTQALPSPCWWLGTKKQRWMQFNQRFSSKNVIGKIQAQSLSQQLNTTRTKQEETITLEKSAGVTMINYEITNGKDAQKCRQKMQTRFSYEWYRVYTLYGVWMIWNELQVYTNKILKSVWTPTLNHLFLYSVFQDTLILGAVGSNNWQGNLYEVTGSEAEMEIKDSNLNNDSYNGTCLFHKDMSLFLSAVSDMYCTCG